MREKRPAGFWPACLLVTAALAVLFLPSFLPGRILFSNDLPFGLLMSEPRRLPGALAGIWSDLNSVGTYDGVATPGVTCGIKLLLGGVGYAKFYAPLALLILGLGAWCFFKQLRLAPAACALGGLAAALNSGFFSDACWGVGSHEVGVGMTFLALAALVDTSSPRRWLRTVVAGVAVGIGVSEGVDVGGLFSLCVGLFILYQSWVAPKLPGERAWRHQLSTGAGRLAVVGLVALCLVLQTIITIAATSLRGSVRMGGDVSSGEAHWDWATQWSLPKREALGLAVPGLFGYRMDSREGGSYWGAIGRAPAWDRYFEGGKQGPTPGGMIRYSGGGDYVGILVLAIGFWAALRSWRKADSIFSDEQKKWLQFWSILGAASLLLAFGRFAPFYRLFYLLPYGSTMRNPIKFLCVFEFAMVILFAYGLDDLIRGYLGAAPGVAGEGRWSLRDAWSKLVRFDRAWLKGLLLALELALAAWVVYFLTRGHLATYLQDVDFDANEAGVVAAFSVRQAGLALFFWALAFSLLLLILTGFFQGRRGRAGVLLLALFLVLDLGRANLPWIVYWDYPSKYASNPVIEALREHPFEHRVAHWSAHELPEFLLLDQLYHIEWMQHHFPYYNIQSLDFVQIWSKPPDLAAFEAALRYDGTTNTFPHVARCWQLTNTRYVLGAGGALRNLNQQLGPGLGPFRILRQFEIIPKPGIALATRCEELTTELRTNGHYALFEFTGALPRAKLYSDWEVNTNSQALLERLVSPEFDPQQTVLLAKAPPIESAPPSGGSSDRQVEFISYAPKDVVLKTKASTPTVLLLNDRLETGWRVFVDGSPKELLCCNYLMRGVALGPGVHRVEFRFAVSTWMSYVTLAMLIAGLVLSCLLLVSREGGGTYKNEEGRF